VFAGQPENKKEYREYEEEDIKIFLGHPFNAGKVKIFLRPLWGGLGVKVS